MTTGWLIMPPCIRYRWCFDLATVSECGENQPENGARVQKTQHQKYDTDQLMQ
jgi:hypothetical protein